MNAVKIHVDPDLCMASEVCISSFPGSMGMDDSTQTAVPLAGAAALSEADAEEMEELCPTGAIRLQRS